MRKSLKKVLDGPGARRNRWVDVELERIALEGGVVRGMLAEMIARSTEREENHERDMARLRAAGLPCEEDLRAVVRRYEGPLLEEEEADRRTSSPRRESEAGLEGEAATERRPRRGSMRELFFDCLTEPVGSSSEGVSSLRATVDNTVVLGIWDRACLVSEICIYFCLLRNLYC
jgi:hypothetical protein